MTTDSRSAALSKFATWVQANIRGDEKGEAQVFLDRLFVAFGHPGSLDVGGKPEFRVRKSTQDGGGTSFADYVWKPVVLIEMKKRGERLSRHYRQAFDYWTRLVPDRPRYVVLCNFDEFEVYDFETQMDTPVGRTTTTLLPNAYGPLAFLFPGQPKPVFTDDHVAVTREAAAKLARCFNKLVKRGVPRPISQRFILQMLVSFFAEDIGLLEKYFVVRLLNDCVDDNAFDLLDGLFKTMNNPQGASGGRFKGVPYFNGGLFTQSAALELSGPEIVLLRECAASDWSKVRPEIFGTIFEQTLERDERHAYGAHFTHPVDIMKIVGPTIVEPWREQIKGAKTLTRLRELLNRLQHFHVLDPACGSGNFLYIAYRELKRLEAAIFERMETDFKRENAKGQMRLSFLTALNFHGIDVNPFAIELAKVTMVLAHKLAIDELHITEHALPLDNLDANFTATDALIQSQPLGLEDHKRNWRAPILREGKATRVKWPKVDVIIGNPPFNGAKKLKPDLGPDYVNALREAYPEVPGMADFCVFWFHRARLHLAECTKVNPVSGRAGLVGTQNIRNNQSRVGGLDQIVTDGTIIEAVDNQPWSGEAQVHVSIANWARSQDNEVVPKLRKLWTKVEPSEVAKRLRKRENEPSTKEYELEMREVSYINSSLSDKTDVSLAVELLCNKSPKRVFQGVTPGNPGFMLTAEARSEILSKDSSEAEVIIPYLIGRELVSGDGSPQRFVIDFDGRDILAAKAYTEAFKIVTKLVLPDIEKKAEKEHADENAYKSHLQRWWHHWRRRGDMKEAIRGLGGRYILGSRTQRLPFIYCFMDAEVLPSDLLQVFAFDDDYSFGVLQSLPHTAWYSAKAARKKYEEDFTYSSESVFETFPWPQEPSRQAVVAVAAAGRELRAVRGKFLSQIEGGLRELYKTLSLPGNNPLRDAHAALDSAVIDAYDFSHRKDLLTQLFDLNKLVADRIEKQEDVMAPGIPSSFKNPRELITKDCLHA